MKFSTNGTMLTPAAARRLAAMDYVDVQVSVDGADADTNDAMRGPGSYAAARRAMDNLAEAGFGSFKISVVVTRHNIAQLDELEALATVVPRAASTDPAARRPGAARTPGPSCTRPRSSSGPSMPGCAPGPACSPATPSSTCPRWASRCPG